MIQLVRKTSASKASDSILTLTFEQRSKSRLRAETDDGREVVITLTRGIQLLPGDILESEDGQKVAVRAAREQVSVVRSEDAHRLARACYHLGNRHIALQIDPGELRYLHDHVLDEMVALLGLEVVVKQAAFEPESGAYGAHAHIQGHHH